MGMVAWEDRSEPVAVRKYNENLMALGINVRVHVTNTSTVALAATLAWKYGRWRRWCRWCYSGGVRLPI
jgi:hypothetical protein